MVDRISTLQIFQTGVNNILQRQAEVARTQQELATGQRLLSPVDDPAGAVRAASLEQDISRVDQFQRNASLAEGQLGLSDSTLGSAVQVLQRVRELTVQANNATLGPDSRGAIAIELEERLEELIAIANTRDANEEFIFAGFQAQQQPFTKSGPTVAYSGDDGQRFLDISDRAQVAVRDSGARVFLSVPAGNGNFDFSVDGNSGTARVSSSAADASFVRDDYTVSFIQASADDPVTYEVTDSAAAVVATGTYVSGEAISFSGASLNVEGEPENGDSIAIDSGAVQSVFDTISSIADALRGSTETAANDAEINTAMASGLNNLDQAIGNISEVRAEVGGRLNRLESQQQINDDFNLKLQGSLSEIQDLDYAEAISRLNLQVVALQAAQQTYVTSQRLSLFDYL